MGFRLRYQQHDFELTEGEFVIGRSASCQLSLDDPLVSRSHAKLTVTADAVLVEDMGSRNGVRVNGQRVEGRRALSHGDKVGIGSQEMTLLYKREARAETLAQQPATQRVNAFGLLGGLADKAIALGRGDEAERILATHLEQILEDAREGYVPPADIGDRAAHYACKLAAITSKGSWVDYIFALYASLKRPAPGEVVDELYTVLRRVRHVDVGALRSYVQVLKAHAAELTPAERFLLSRIEGLERLAALR
jgi:hypothetical protein